MIYTGIHPGTNQENKHLNSEENWKIQQNMQRKNKSIKNPYLFQNSFKFTSSFPYFIIFHYTDLNGK